MGSVCDPRLGGDHERSAQVTGSTGRSGVLPRGPVSDVEAERIVCLNDAAVDRDGRYVLYWMQQSQRVESNPALEYAIERANELDLPLVAAFGLFVREGSSANSTSRLGGIRYRLG